MNELKKLIIQSVDLWCRERCLKHINKEFDKYRKYTEKATRCKDKASLHLKIALKMNEEYNKKFTKEREG